MYKSIVTMSDDEGTELTTTKEECSFLELRPTLPT